MFQTWVSVFTFLLFSIAAITWEVLINSAIIIIAIIAIIATIAIIRQLEKISDSTVPRHGTQAVNFSPIH